jgi:hypothetical protein
MHWKVRKNGRVLPFMGMVVVMWWGRATCSLQKWTNTAIYGDGDVVGESDLLAANVSGVWHLLPLLE